MRSEYLQRYYENNWHRISAQKKKHYASLQPHVPGEELERLRTPENRSESLSYGPGQKVVCLNCGRIGSNIGHHLSGCLVTPEKSESYKLRWGFSKSNPLTSPSQREKYSQAKRQSPKMQQWLNRSFRSEEWQTRNRRPPWNKGKGQAMSLEGRLRHRGKRIGARPHRQKIPDGKVLEILRLDLPISESAKLAGLSQTAFYRRAQRLGHDMASIKARRELIRRYIYDLRTWLLTQPECPTIEQVSQRHIANLRSADPVLYRSFNPYFGHLEQEVHEHPNVIKELRNKADGHRAALAFTSRIFGRSRQHLGQKPRKSPGRHRLAPRERTDFRIGVAVEDAISHQTKLLEIRRALSKKIRKDPKQLRIELSNNHFTSDQIEAGRNAQSALIAARREVSVAENLDFDTVATYHKRYINSIRRPKN